MHNFYFGLSSLKNCLFHIWTCIFIKQVFQENFSAEITREYYIIWNGME